MILLQKHRFDRFNHAVERIWRAFGLSGSDESVGLPLSILQQFVRTDYLGPLLESLAYTKDLPTWIMDGRQHARFGHEDAICHDEHDVARSRRSQTRNWLLVIKGEFRMRLHRIISLQRHVYEARYLPPV